MHIWRTSLGALCLVLTQRRSVWSSPNCAVEGVPISFLVYRFYYSEQQVSSLVVCRSASRPCTGKNPREGRRCTNLAAFLVTQR